MRVHNTHAPASPSPHPTSGRPEEAAYCNMERYLQGSFIKYSSNAGYVNTKDYRATLQVEVDVRGVVQIIGVRRC